MAITTDMVLNSSSVPGATLTQALNWLLENKISASTSVDPSDVVNLGPVLVPTHNAIARLLGGSYSGVGPTEGQIVSYVDGEITWVDP